MAKRKLTSIEAFDLRQGLHVATLEALMASRRWEPGDLIFHGGTSLHLAFSSPRLSEDLDFLVKSNLNLNNIAKSVGTRLAGANWLPRDAQLRVKAAKDLERNPHMFVVSIGGENLIGSVHVKVEMWQADPAVLDSMKTVVAPIRVATGAVSGMQAFVPTAELSEIYSDKLFALAARPYLKSRDVFDLHWLSKQHPQISCTADDMLTRLQTYPNQSAESWLEKAFVRRDELKHAGPQITKELAYWLPSSWPLSEQMGQDMAASSITSLDRAIDTMRQVRDQAKGNTHDISN